MYVSGELLYDHKAVLEISQTQKNVFSVFVKDGSLYEVELFKPNTKNQTFSCECETFRSEKSCRHIVAALMGFKDIKQASRVKKTGKPRTLNINALLQNVAHDELSAFVKSYSGRDKKFANALKIHFARKVELEDNQEKYRQILDGLIKPVTGKDTKQNSKTDLKVFCQVVDDFLAQTEDALVLEEYVEAFYIIKAALIKSAYVFRHFGDSLSLGFYKTYQQLHDALGRLLKSRPAPELRAEIEEFIKTSLDLSYYELITPANNLLSIALDYAFVNKEFAQKYLDQKLASSKNEQEIPVLYLLLIRYFDSTSEILSKHAVHTGRITQLLIEGKGDELAFEFLHANISRRNDPELIRLYIKLLLEKDGKAAFQEVAGLFLKTRDLRIFDLFEKRGAEQLQEFIEVIRSQKEYEKLVASIHYPYFLARIHQLDTLLSYLNEHPSLELLMRFDQQLYEHRPNLVTVMYENLVHEYLQVHVGDQSKTFVNQIYGHLYKIGATRLVKRLQEMVDEEFRYRSGKSS